jgi:hypothetical protein
VETADGGFQIRANEVEILARPPLPPAVPAPSVITLLAAGTGADGRVNIRGSQGVRITSGFPPLPPTGSDTTNGLEIGVDDVQSIAIQRGVIGNVQEMQMTPAGITIDAGLGAMTIQSLTSITLSVAGGLSSITLTPTGITIQGILVQIN